MLDVNDAVTTRRLRFETYPLQSTQLKNRAVTDMALMSLVFTLAVVMLCLEVQNFRLMNH